MIVGCLPQQERAFFLAQYRQRAQAAADDIAGYQALQRFLNMWGHRARIVQRLVAENPSYYDDLTASVEEIRNGTVETVPIEAMLADRYGISIEEATEHWQAKVEQAKTTRST